ncbi:hypothetical protein [Curtobacterium sp. Leaf261]|uniref:hypothetical protein n=1 Tax=Curtobacterium sp. Leaf261 TaxID=1736311 RepID=UPI000702070C|nr:hypothetical protein [Curtobacterium sp. Leaf261]KQO63394.1 hypothetical protein ASF23_03780 [Curtobacterium sp. Leaf261]
MKHIVYSENRVLTGDDVAAAVMRYAATLAQRNTADIVDVPTTGQDGFAASVEVLLGPASHIMVEDAEDDELETAAVDFVADLDRRAAAVRGGHVPEPPRPSATSFGSDIG